jgi:hypothetical protein
MRRLASIAAFALLLCVPLWAQHGGGGHGGGGGHAGFSGGHSGGVSSGSFGGGHFSGGTRGASSFSGPLSGASRGFSSRGFTSRNFSRGPYLHDGFHGNQFGHVQFHTYGFRNNCYGYRCGWGWGYGYGYPWWGSAYYDPWWWNQDDRNFDNDYYGQYDMANQMNEQSLEQQRMMRQEEADGDQDAYAPRAPERRRMDPVPSAQPQGSPIIPPTVLVFRDQHREETENYAIVGQTLWNFSPQKTEKIALANLDLPATEKANDDRGVTFRIPGSVEGQ